MEARGVADLDIPTLVIGIECDEKEWIAVADKRKRYEKDPDKMLRDGEVSKGRSGAKPGPK